MDTKSKSLAKIVILDSMPKNLHNIYSIHKKVSSRVYGDKALNTVRDSLYTSALIYEYNKPPPIHMHKDKRFIKTSQSSPAKRMQKLKEARLFKNNCIFRSVNSKITIGSHIDQINTIKHKPFGIGRQSSQAIFIEKENEKHLRQLSQDFLTKIQLNTKTIKKQIEKSSDYKINTIKTVPSDQVKNKNFKILVINN
ncbi:hypothetical protein SteCoe_30170 [Stentor coeruleus]|uniref:Uncharacterized protein n=1 Tax=Stentor coeruleus TaxID=5963 RepID=A0A1R2B4A8_9CILI|nr:hypothetical protein SteCoe_30170 [Stentor coeruleus]